MIKLKNILTEEVYGNKATVYHRTRSANLLTSLLMDGFKHSSGMYGEGIYTTYEPTEKINWKSSGDPNAKDADINPEGRNNYHTYGNYQIKFSVDLINFFIFDWDVYKEVKPHVSKIEKFTKQTSDINNFINLQAEYFKLKTRINTPYRKRYTSEIALKFGFVQEYTFSSNPLINGIVFFGSTDGNVLVCYNKSMIVPLSVTNSDTNETINLQKLLDSDMKLKNEFKAYFKKFIKSKDESMSNVKKPILDIAKEKWTYNETTNMFSFDGNVKITEEFINDGKLLIKFDKVTGDFYCNDTSLTSLYGVPNSVGRDFDCSNTKIIDLKQSPKYVGRDFNCSECKLLTSLNGAPNEINRSFYCIECINLKSLYDSPNYVHKDFDCYLCKSLTSLQGAPNSVGGYFDCNMCISLESIQDIPSAIKYYVPNKFIRQLNDIIYDRNQ